MVKVKVRLIYQTSIWYSKNKYGSLILLSGQRGAD